MATGHSDVSISCDAMGTTCTQVGITQVPVAAVMGWVGPSVITFSD